MHDCNTLLHSILGFSANITTMKRIKLTHGKFAIVDNDDFDMLSEHKWCAVKKSKTFYAVSRINGKVVYMHHLILSIRKNQVIDHIDGNGLNNRRENLRRATRQQNLLNRGVQKNNSSGKKGVTYCRQTKKWRAIIAYKRKQVCLGRHESKELASMAYKRAAKKYHKQFAKV
jgi:hypothetical protein